MNGNWTPGPWTANIPWPDAEIWIGTEHPKVGRVTHASVRSGCAEADELGDMTANAHLIAAAPELYEALELIIPMAKGYVAINNIGNNAAFIAQAEEAIRKARGKA